MNMRIVGLVIILLAGIGILAWYTFFGSVTQFSSDYRYLYIYPDSTGREKLLKQLQRDSMLSKKGSFDWLARQKGFYEKVKPGKFKIPKGTNPVELLKILAANQEEVKLVINKLRLPKDLSALISRKTMYSQEKTDAFFLNNDSLSGYKLDTALLLTAVLPNTYNIYWTSSPSTILEKLVKESESWWKNDNREALLDSLKLSKNQAYTIASIVDEETRIPEEKPLIASVYLNRLKKGMPLQADPTVKFARRDFLANRILYSHLKTPSPYNTYINRGLPPGPICTAQPATIDSVLHAPKTDYLYFVAKADFSGYSVFNTNLSDHNKAAKVYQDSLTAWLKRKAEREKLKSDSTKAANIQ